MSVGNVTNTGCRSGSHYRERWAIYESLPREVRDRLKRARGNLCAGCVRNSIRRNALEFELKSLDRERRYRREGAAGRCG